jgi:V8-like Glu-specific endopeptidase
MHVLISRGPARFLRQRACSATWSRRQWVLLAALASAPAVATAETAVPSRAGLAFTTCDASASDVAATRTVARFVDGRLRRWQELDLPGGTCAVELGARPRALSPAEASALYRLRAEPTQPKLVSNAVAGDRRGAARRGTTTEVAREPSLQDLVRRQNAGTTAGKSVRHRLSAPVLAKAAPDLDAARALPDRTASPLVFGADNRIRVTNTNPHPFRTMVFVLSEFPDGSLLGFSGFLAAPFTVLTAAQALYQDALGGFVVSVQVFPGQTQAGPGANPTSPFGDQFGAEVEVPSGWLANEDPADNYGAVFLDNSFAGIDEFLPVVFGLVPPANAEMAGYDAFAQGEQDSLALWRRDGATDGFTADFVFHLLDDDEGAIGAPLWDGVDRVFAVDCCVADDDSANVGVRFTSANRNLVEQWLAFEGSGGDPLTGPPLVLGNGRFEVRAAFRTSAGQEGDANPFVLTADTGYFWFFDDDNVELVVKVLNACDFNQRYWVYGGGLTDVEVTIDVVDTLADVRQRYMNPLGTAFQPITDSNAFATCP